MVNVLTSLLQRQTAKYDADRPALWQRTGTDCWEPVTWHQFSDRAARVACALEILGVKPEDRVAIFAPNDPKTLYTDMGCFANRAVPVSIYATSSPEQVEYIARDSQARVLFAGTREQYEICRQVASNLPDLRQIVVFDDIELAPGDTTTMLFDSLLKLGESATEACRKEVAARTAASKQPELAEKFLKFMISPAFQNAIPTGNWMYPVTDVALPAGFEQLNKPQTSLEFTPQQVAAQRAAWISEWQRAVSR